MKTKPSAPMKCIQCQFDNHAEDAFCSSCGASLASNVQHCPKCNAANAIDATFCQMCAAPLSRPSRSTENPTTRLELPAGGLPAARRARRVWPALAGLCCLLGGYAGGTLWRDHVAAPPPSPSSMPSPTAAVTLVPPLDATVTPSQSQRLTGMMSASSTQPPFVPALAEDGHLETCWMSAVHAKPTSCWLQLELPNKALLNRLGVAVGSGRPPFGFDHFARLRRVRFEFDESSLSHDFEDRPQIQYIDLTTPVYTRKIRMLVQSVYAGRDSSQLAIPELEAWGHVQGT